MDGRDYGLLVRPVRPLFGAVQPIVFYRCPLSKHRAVHSSMPLVSLQTLLVLGSDSQGFWPQPRWLHSILMQSGCQRLVYTDLQEELAITLKQECHTRARRKHWHVFLTGGRETWRRPRVPKGYLVVFVLPSIPQASVVRRHASDCRARGLTNRIAAGRKKKTTRPRDFSCDRVLSSR